MTRTSALWSALAFSVGAATIAACSAHGPTSSGSVAAASTARNVDLTKMTCAEFLTLGEDVQPRAVAWLDGYSKAGTLKAQDVGEVDIDRQMDVLVVACKQDPKPTFWDKVRAHLPGGSRKVKPTKMTCQEFMDLSETERPEVAYWLDGYNHGVQQQVAVQVDLQRDVAVIVVECKPVPKESLWTKIKQHF